MNIPRLRALSARLRTYNGPFNMISWTHCACGVACTMPEFNVLGLHSHGGLPSLKGEDGARAVELFFDLSRQQVAELFTTVYYKDRPITPSHVADHIDELIDAAPQVMPVEKREEVTA